MTRRCCDGSGCVLADGWVRISDSESGNLLALGPLRAPVDVPGEHQAEAQISFGLSLEPDDTPV